jgi:hypothetical protein
LREQALPRSRHLPSHWKGLQRRDFTAAARYSLCVPRYERGLVKCAGDSRTRRTSLTALFAEIKRKLSARDFARSICKTVEMGKICRAGAPAQAILTA